MTASARTDVTSRIKQAAARDQHWDKDVVEVGLVDTIAHGGCRFYRASNPSQTDRLPVEYALLPDGQTLVTGTTHDAAARILQACGMDAPATWWAQVVSRYAPAGGVLVDEHAPSAIRRIDAAGHAGYLPALRAEGGAKVLTFYTHDYARDATWQVTARLDAGGKLTIEKSAL